MAQVTVESAADVFRCPVCPALVGRQDDLRCGSCGSDLSAFHRVRDLPRALLDTAIDLLRSQQWDEARQLLSAAALSPQSRTEALLLLGKCEAQVGQLHAALNTWESIEHASAEAARCRRAVLREQAVRAWSRRKHQFSCPSCGGADIAGDHRPRLHLVGVVGSRLMPRWKCTSCGEQFAGDAQMLIYRGRIPPRRAYAIMHGLLRGFSAESLAHEMGYSSRTVRRLAARAASLGPAVLHEIAHGLRVPVARLQPAWIQFMTGYGSTEERETANASQAEE